MTKTCSVCVKPIHRAIADANPAISAAALERLAEQDGVDLSADRIRTHRAHRATEIEFSPVAKQKRDFAIMVRDRAADLFEDDHLDLRDKDHVPGINSGLKAQATIDRREQAAKQQTGAASLIQLLLGFRRDVQPVALLDDGMTIDGEAVELD